MKFHTAFESQFMNVTIFSRYLARLSHHRALSGAQSRMQLLRFLLVGVLNTVLGYGAFLFFLGYTNYMISLIVAHIIGVLHSFVWNKYWTFKSKKLILNEFVRFNLVYVGYLALNAAILVFFVEILNLDPRIGQLIALPILTIVSFAGHKYWSFAGGKT